VTLWRLYLWRIVWTSDVATISTQLARYPVLWPTFDGAPPFAPRRQSIQPDGSEIWLMWDHF
jgi:hypothetical protein